jgi:hypothetical protein
MVKILENKRGWSKQKIRNGKKRAEKMIFSADSLRRSIEIRRSGLTDNFAEWTCFVKKTKKRPEILNILQKYIVRNGIIVINMVHCGVPT